MFYGSERDGGRGGGYVTAQEGVLRPKALPEPLFGFGEGKATGFSEEEVAAYEKEAGIRLFAALRI